MDPAVTVFTFTSVPLDEARGVTLPEFFPIQQ